MSLNRILHRIPLRGNFEDVLFWGVLFFSFLAALASTIFTSVENLGTLAVVYTAIITLYFVVLGSFVYLTRKTELGYVIMVLGLNSFIIPPMFFICGAFDSGMPFYCLASIFLTSLLARLKIRIVMMVYSILVYGFIFVFDFLHPDISPSLKPFDMVLDRTVSFVFMAFLIFVVVSYLLRAYRRERDEKDALISRLDFLSTHDPLTGLFNRRSFVEIIRNKVLANPTGFYLLMFDIDHFKILNDRFGHLFGDQVLRNLGKLARETFSTDGEMAVRYGGEEFILLIRGDCYENAMLKAERFREAVIGLKFTDNPEVCVHISGGFVDCSDVGLKNHDKLLSTVDELLYVAKNNGRDQIVGRK